MQGCLPSALQRSGWGTGLAVDGSKQPELKPHMDKILLWSDRGFENPRKLGCFPYLGPHFEFLEKKKGCAPYLNEIYCFNYGACVSHSGLSFEIPRFHLGPSGSLRESRPHSS